jgi:nickel-dependent lactate racemase
MTAISTRDEIGQVRLAYGKTGIEIRLPADANARLLRTRPCPSIDDPDRAIRGALEDPTESASLATLARGRKNACVVICDVTRPVPNATLLPPILATLEEAGIGRDTITILIATGIHRPNLGAELVELVGAEIAGRYNTVNHLSREDGELRHIGETDAGIPLFINRHYLDADLKVLTGFIEPHLWAGYSGGRKLILPGIAGLETMKYMHNVEMIDHPGTRYGNLEDNPFHEAGLEVARRVGVDFIVNVTLNEDKKITGVFAGHYDKAHSEGVKFCEEYAVAEIDGPVDLAITTNGGYPLDQSVYQSVKGMSGANAIVRPGGTILIATRCEAGTGSPEFTDLLERADSADHLLEMLRQPGFFEVDQWIAQEMCRILKQKRVCIFTEGLTPQQIRRALLEPVNDLQRFIDDYLAKQPTARVAVIPEGPYVIARLNQAG